MEQVFGYDTRIQSVLEQAGDFSRSNSAAETVGCIAWDKKSLLRDVVERSKETGVWIPDISGIVDKVIGYGQENDVFLSVDGLHVVKLNNFVMVDVFKIFSKINKQNKSGFVGFVELSQVLN